MTTLVNRADLLACLKHCDESRIDEFAAILGYAVIESSKNVDAVGIVGNIAITATLNSMMSVGTVNTNQARFLHVIAHRRFKDDEVITEQPLWYQEAQPYQDNDADLKAPEGLSPPKQKPLMAWRRLWPFLKLALGANTLSHKPDLPRIVDRIARGKLLRRLPKAKRKGWASQAQLVIDFDPSLLPFWADFNGLHEQLADLRGQAGLNVLAFPDGDPFGACWHNTSDGWRTINRYNPPQAGAPVLVLSDLGCNEVSEQRRMRWRRFGAQLARSGCRPVALMPSPPRWWDAELTQVFIAVYWDRAVRPPQRLTGKTAYTASAKPERDNPATEQLLSLLATAVRIEPALLREARFLFPAKAMDVGAEFAAWNHPALQTTPLACYFQPSQVSHYRDRLRDDPDLSTEQKQQIAELLNKHHAHLSPVIHYEEQLALAELLVQASPDNAERFAQRLAKTVGESEGEISDIAMQWLSRVALRQEEQDAFWNNPYLSTALVAAYKKDGVTHLPKAISLKKFAWMLGAKPPVDSQIVQCGQELLLTDAARGSRIGSLRHSTDYLQIETDAEHGARWYTFDQPIAITPGQPLLIRSDREELTLEWLTMPSWAEVIGQDRYGLYADLNLNGIVQRFRWIAPGTFMMGSPASEPERLRWETQHEVTLTQGYWLADSACTQALWRAIMDDNPSEFKDDLNHPVENVSWNDSQRFIERLNTNFTSLDVRLPTEAEWEYACRAGTNTPFSFGDNITPEKVNYNGNHPYVGDKKDIYREKTVPVKSLPVNPWGLYEMHGNVWEWCEDWFGDYPNEAVVNPTGAETGDVRVMRGGSWHNYAGGTRSAKCHWNAPDLRIKFIGFRLALGRKDASSPAGKEGGWPDGQPRGSGGGQAGHSTPDSNKKGNKKS